MTGPDESFVGYLRRSFRYGGFAGWHGATSVPTLIDLGARLLPL